MNIIWRIFDVMLTIILMVVTSFIALLSWLFQSAKNSRRRYVIRTHYKGDAAAYERNQWKQL